MYISIKNPKLKWNKSEGMLCMLYTSHGTSAGWALTVRNKIKHFFSCGSHDEHFSLSVQGHVKRYNVSHW